RRREPGAPRRSAAAGDRPPAGRLAAAGAALPQGGARPLRRSGRLGVRGSSAQVMRKFGYTLLSEAGDPRSASREAEGTGPVKPRQPARPEQGANPGRATEPGWM